MYAWGASTGTAAPGVGEVIGAYRLTSWASSLYVVEEAATGEPVFWSLDGELAYDAMLIANGLRAGVEN